MNNPAQSGPVPQTNVPGLSRRITRSAAKATHQTNTHSTPAQITFPAGNRPTQSGLAELMNLFCILVQIAHSILPGNSSAQSRPAYPTSTHSTPSMTSLFGPSPPGNSSIESGSAHPTNTPCTTDTLPLFLPTPPGDSSTESGSAHQMNAPITTSTPLLFTLSPPGNSPTQSGSTHPTNAPSMTSTPRLFTPSPPRNSPTQSVRGYPANDPGKSKHTDPMNNPGTSALGEILMILFPCFSNSLTKKT